MSKLIGKLFSLDGDTYRIGGVGATDERGTFVHGFSIFRFRKQYNGESPFQVCVYIDESIVREDCTVFVDE